MNALLKTMLTKLALLTTLLAGAEHAKAGHLDPPTFGFGIRFGGCSTTYWHGPAVHRHHFRHVYEQVWFAPVYEIRVVGYTSCGTPITRRVCVTAGHYKTAVYKVCGCGKKEFLHYI
jgi:hypothetical protein